MTRCSQNAALTLSSTTVHRQHSAEAEQRMLQRSQHTRQNYMRYCSNAAHDGHSKQRTVRL